MSPAYLSCGYDVESLHWSELQSADEVLVVVAILAVDALSVHHLELVGKHSVRQFAEERKTQVTSVLHAVQRVAAAARKVSRALGIDVDGLHGRRRELVLV